MAVFEVSGRTGSIRVEGDNWLAALGSSLAFFGLDPASLGRLVIDVAPSGSVDVRDPISGQAFHLRPADNASPSPVRLQIPTPSKRAGPPPPPAVRSVVPAAALPPPPESPLPDVEPEGEPLELELDDEDDGPFVAPPLFMQVPAGPVAEPWPAPAEVPPPAARPEPSPAPSRSPAPAAEPAPPSPLGPRAEGEGSLDLVPGPARPEGDRPGDLAILAFEASQAISYASTVEGASDRALSAVRELVGVAQAGCVLHAGMNAQELRFTAAFGPAAGQLLGGTIPLDMGVAGFCHRTGLGMLVKDTETDPHHDPSVGEQVGYRTRALLAVAVRHSSGTTFGCLELLNPTLPFRDWHLEAAQMVAGALADYLAARI